MSLKNSALDGITKPVVEREMERRMVAAINKGENPSIGIIMCADRDHFEVEYALRGIQKPVGVAKYRLTRELPKTLAGKLPDAEKLKREIMKELEGKETRNKNGIDRSI